MYRIALPFALLSLLASPLGAQTASAQDVDFTQAMECSSLYTVLAAAVEGEPEYDEFVDVSARWLVIASLRDGREEIVAEPELQAWADNLLAEIEAQSDDTAREEFLFEGIDICDARYQLIAEEFDTIEM